MGTFIKLMGGLMMALALGLSFVPGTAQAQDCGATPTNGNDTINCTVNENNGVDTDAGNDTVNVDNGVTVSNPGGIAIDSDGPNVTVNNDGEIQGGGWWWPRWR